MASRHRPPAEPSAPAARGAAPDAGTRRRRLVIYGNPQVPGVGAVLAELWAWAAARGMALSIADDIVALAAAPPGAAAHESYPAEDGSRIMARPDEDPLLVCLGGDGTILHAVRHFWPFRGPVLGVNLGSLSFNAAVDPERVTQVVENWMAGRAAVSRRILLQARLSRSGQVTEQGIAVNDLVVSKHADARVIHLTMRQGEELVSAFIGDGLIVSTPTGSTAYNLSAGGPIVYPTLEAIVATAICPHTLASRPVVLPPAPPLTLQFVPHHGRDQATIWLDGQVAWEFRQGDEVSIGPADRPIDLLVGTDMSYFERLRSKLAWSGEMRPAGLVQEGSGAD